MQSILSLIRWKNLLMIAAMQFLIKFALLEPFNVGITLNWFGFSLLILATVFIAAAGYIINDIKDIETDLQNKPDQIVINNGVGLKTAYSLFIALNVMGVAIGFYLSHLIGKSGFFALFVIISALLYLYSTYLKQMLIVGNLLISTLVAFTIIIVGLFEILPAITPVNIETQRTYFGILWDYALFAFMLNLVREVAKDLQDVDGDYKAGMNTLPIAIGRERANKVLFVLILIPIAAIVYYLLSFLYKQQLIVMYFLIATIAPLIYAAIKTLSAKKPKDYGHIALVLKLVMVAGMCSLLLYKFILL